ncbi:hypothetical protein [Burkholderia cenocepacia]|uniref:hypothetical protein n=1 Tax=Burkholderia cenocepacia TaxID=95486 RepID=UPI000F590065|nr:hypothetical protein [Burkholderia cenocepacia]
MSDNAYWLLVRIHQQAIRTESFAEHSQLWDEWSCWPAIPDMTTLGFFAGRFAQERAGVSFPPIAQWLPFVSVLMVGYQSVARLSGHRIQPSIALDEIATRPLAAFFAGASLQQPPRHNTSLHEPNCTWSSQFWDHDLMEADRFELAVDMKLPGFRPLHGSPRAGEVLHISPMSSAPLIGAVEGCNALARYSGQAQDNRSIAAVDVHVFPEVGEGRVGYVVETGNAPITIDVRGNVYRNWVGIGQNHHLEIEHYTVAQKNISDLSSAVVVTSQEYCASLIVNRNVPKILDILPRASVIDDAMSLTTKILVMRMLTTLPSMGGVLFSVSVLGIHSVANALMDPSGHIQSAALSPERRYLNWLNGRYRLQIRFDKRLEVIVNGRRAMAYITNILKNDEGKIERVFYPNYFPGEMIEDIEDYRERNVDAPTMSESQLIDEHVATENEDFSRVMSAYADTRGNRTEINARIQQGTLPADANESWSTIEMAMDALNEAWQQEPSARNVTETLQFYDEHILSLDEPSVGQSRAENRHRRNRVIWIRHAQREQHFLSEEIEKILIAMQTQSTTISSVPYVAQAQAAILACRLPDPSAPSQVSQWRMLSDREILANVASLSKYQVSAPDFVAWVSARRMLIYYVISHLSDSGCVEEIISGGANEFYRFLSKAGYLPSIEGVVSKFEKSVLSPAEDYGSILGLRPISEFGSDSAFYSHINNYKSRDARSEALDLMHYQFHDSGIFPLDLVRPLREVVALVVSIPKFGANIFTRHHRNHYEDASGRIYLFRAESGDYGILSTVMNVPTLRRISANNFSRFKKGVKGRGNVHQLLIAAGHAYKLLPKPATKNYPFRKMENRYYAIRLDSDYRGNYNGSLSEFIVGAASDALMAFAEDAKKFRFTDRWVLPSDWSRRDVLHKMDWFINNLKWTVEDAIGGFFKPLEMLARILRDSGYKPDEEDWIDFAADMTGLLLAAGGTLWSIGKQGVRSAMRTYKSARLSGLRGKALRRAVYEATWPYLRAGSLGLLRETVGEILPFSDVLQHVALGGRWLYRQWRWRNVDLKAPIGLPMQYPIHTRIPNNGRMALANAFRAIRTEGQVEQAHWEFALDLIGRARKISAEAAVILRNTAQQLVDGRVGVDAIFSREYREIVSFDQLTRIAPGRLVLLTRDGKLEYMLVSYGGGAFMGSGGNAIQLGTENVPVIIFAEDIEKAKHALVMNGQNDGLLIFAGDVKIVRSSDGSSHVFEDRPNKLIEDSTSATGTREQEYSRDEMILGRDAALSIVGYKMVARFHGAPWVSSSYMDTSDVARFIQVRAECLLATLSTRVEWDGIRIVELESCYAGLGGVSSVGQIVATTLRKRVRATGGTFSDAVSSVPAWGRVFEPQSNVNAQLQAENWHRMMGAFSRTVILPLMRLKRRAGRLRIRRDIAPEKSDFLRDSVSFIYGEISAGFFSEAYGLTSSDTTVLRRFPIVRYEDVVIKPDDEVLDLYYSLMIMSDGLEKKFVDIVKSGWQGSDVEDFNSNVDVRDKNGSVD